MVNDPLDDSEPYEVKIVKEGVVPRKPVYDPVAVLDFIKGNGNQITLRDLEEHLGHLLGMCAFTDFDITGLISATDEFKVYEDGSGHLIYELTRLGLEVDGDSLMPRPTVNHINLEGRDLEKVLKQGFDEATLRKLRFPTYSEN